MLPRIRLMIAWFCTELLTRSRGQSPRDGVEECLIFPSLARKRGQSPRSRVFLRRLQLAGKKPGTVPARWGSGMLALFPSLTRNSGTVPARWGVFCFPAPTGQNEIAQGKAKRRPGYIGAWISRCWVPPLQGGTLFRRSNPQGVALGFHLAPRWGKRQETGDSPRAIRSSIRRTVTGVFPPVTWPSEAVRVDDESIAFIHKQVGAPFYGRATRCWSDQSPNAASWGAWLNPTPLATG